MLSRCWCISRAWSRSTNSWNSLNVRNNHVLVGSLISSDCRAKNDTTSQKSPFKIIILERISKSGVSLRRNFSFMPSVFASGAAKATTTTSATTSTATATTTTTENIPVTIKIPEIPVTPTTPVEETFVQSLSANGEPTFASLGLGGYSPTGIVQSGLEYIHVTFDMPWYVTIALSTIIIRILLTPLVVIAQRNAAIMRNVMPEMQQVQSRITEARQMGNAIEYAQSNQDLMKLMKEKNFNPMKNMVTPLAQFPIFLSYYIGIRQMVHAPVESLRTGGIAWFTDLTVADPYYLLPLITCGTLALTIHLGTEAARVPGNESPMVMYILKIVPVVVFPFIMNFPAAMVVYWASSNFVSLIQGQIFRVPKVRTYFNIPQIIEHELPKPTKKQSVVQNVKGAWSNLKMSREIEDRRRLDQINFERAGTGPLVRTYKFDPTKVKKAN